MKKILALFFALALTVGLLSGCAGKPAEESAPEPDNPTAETHVDTVKTGLSLLASVGKSQSASVEGDGLAQADVSLIAVTVDDAGVITDCVIDGVQAKIGFDANGRLTDRPDTEFPSKNELGEDYGMKKASSIGREWNEQAAAFAAYAVGKTIGELKGMAVDESGSAADPDLAASVTIRIGDFLTGIEAAVNSAAHLGAEKGDRLVLTSTADGSKSKDATDLENGQAQAYVNASAVTLRDDVITSCVLDAVQPTVLFDESGSITTDLAAVQPSKNQQGTDYGMEGASSIDKEWNEQAAAFADYVTGKTPEAVAGIAVSETGAPSDADLAASVTISIAPFQALLAKAAQS